MLRSDIALWVQKVLTSEADPRRPELAELVAELFKAADALDCCLAEFGDPSSCDACSDDLNEMSDAIEAIRHLAEQSGGV